LGNVTSKDTGSRSGRKGSAPKYLQRFFLQRLDHVVSVRREHAASLEVAEFDLRLLDKAVYSTYCDCLDLGIGDDARAILRDQYGEKVDVSKSEEELSN
jgi:hypothetical protein